MAATNANAINYFSPAKWVVSPTAGEGTHTTIASALSAASSGDTIFIMPGTYTENITLKAGVNLTAYECDALTPNVTIVGTCTMTVAGTVTITGIRLQTNSAAILSVTGSAASIVNIKNCYLNATNSSAITSTTSNTSSIITLQNCNGDLGTTGIAYFSVAHGFLNIFYCRLANSGASATQSTASSDSSFNCFDTEFDNAFLHSSSSTSAFINSAMRLGGVAVIPVTTSGVGNVVLRYTRIESSTQSSVSVGTGTIVNMEFCDVDSSNTNAITGAGTLVYGGLIFTSTSSTINTSTQTPIPWPLKQGGTNASLTASNGGIFYSTATAGAILAGTATAGQILRSGASTTPAWSTATYPATAGTSGNILTSDGTNIVSSAPAGLGSSLVLISSQVASNSASINFANTSFVEYLLIVDSCIPVTNNALLQLLISTDGGSTYKTTSYVGGVAELTPSAGTGLWTTANSTSAADLSNTIANSAPGYSASINLASIDTGNFLQISGNYIANGIKAGVISSSNNGFTAVTAFQLIMSSGNISSGRFTLYGIRVA